MSANKDNLSFLKIIFYALFATYSFSLLALYTVPIVVPDESAFFSRSVEHATRLEKDGLFELIFSTKNDYRYGSLYWILNGIFAFLLLKFQLLLGLNFKLKLLYFGILRLIYATQLLLIPLLILKKWMPQGDARKSLIVLTAWFTIPLSFWLGKILSPEITTALITALVLCRLKKNEPDWKVYFLIGLANGYRLTSLPLLIFVFLFFHFVRNVRVLVNISRSAFWGLGFIVANPMLLVSPKLIILNFLEKETVRNPTDFSSIGNILSNNDWTWDHIYSGGLLQNIFGILGTTLLAILIFQNKKLFAVYFSTLVFQIILFANSSSMYGWYFFSFTLISFYCFVHFLIELDFKFIKRIKTPQYFVILIIVLAALSNVPTMALSIHDRIFEFSHKMAIDRGEVIKNCYLHYQTKDENTGVIDFSRKTAEEKYFREVSTRWIGYNAFGHLRANLEKIPQNYTRLFILVAKPYQRRVNMFFLDDNGKLKNSDFEITDQKTCDYVELYQLKKVI